MKTISKILAIFVLCMFLGYTAHAQSSEELVEKGTALLESGQHADALAALDQAVTADGNNANAFFKRGKVKSAMQDDNGALADYAKAISLGLENGELYRLKAMSEHLTGNKEGSCADFDKAIQLGDALSEDMKARFCE